MPALKPHLQAPEEPFLRPSLLPVLDPARGHTCTDVVITPRAPDGTEEALVPRGGRLWRLRRAPSSNCLSGRRRSLRSHPGPKTLGKGKGAKVCSSWGGQVGGAEGPVTVGGSQRGPPRDCGSPANPTGAGCEHHPRGPTWPLGSEGFRLTSQPPPPELVLPRGGW